MSSTEEYEQRNYWNIGLGVNVDRTTGLVIKSIKDWKDIVKAGSDLREKYPKKVIGNSPDRTCLTCYTAFSLDKMNKDGTSPCCNTLDHVAVFYESKNK